MVVIKSLDWFSYKLALNGESGGLNERLEKQGIMKSDKKES